MAQSSFGGFTNPAVSVNSAIMAGTTNKADKSSTMTKIADVTLTNNATKIDINNIPNNYNFIKISAFLKSDVTYVGGTIIFNDDITNVYDHARSPIGSVTSTLYTYSTAYNIPIYSALSCSSGSFLDMTFTNITNQAHQLNYFVSHSNGTRPTIGFGSYPITNKITKLSILLDTNNFVPGSYLSIWGYN